MFIFFANITHPAIASQGVGSTKGILLVGNPRSLTSVFERYMRNRGDFNTYFEPAMAKYFQKYIEGGREVAKQVNLEIELMDLIKEVKEPFFIKEQAFTMEKGDLIRSYANLLDYKIVFIIREPSQAVLSMYKLVKKTSELEDEDVYHHLDYSIMERLAKQVYTMTNRTPILIDANKLANEPEAVIEKFCDAVQIPFDAKHLSWDQDPNLHPEENQGWFTAVRKSTSFRAAAKRHSLDDPDVDPKDKASLEKLIEKNLEIYERLKAFAL